MDIGLYGTLSLSSLIGFFYVNRSLSQDRKKLHRFYKAKSFTPAALLDHITSQDLGNLKKNPEDSSEYTLTSFVEGIVDCTHPVTSILNKKTRLIYSYYFKDDLYSNDSMMSEERLRPLQKIQPMISVPPNFEIVDPERPNFRCSIQRNLDVDAFNGVERIAVERTLRRLSFAEKILVFLGSFVEFAAQLTAGALAYRGIKIGVIEDELGIRVGSPLTVFGDIIYNTKSNSIRVDQPLFLVRDKTFIIDKLKDTISGKKIERFLLFTVLVVTSGLLAKSIWKRYVEHRKHKKLSEIEMIEIEQDVNEVKHKERDLELLKGKADNVSKLPELMRCVLCNNAQRSIVADPCHHLSMCNDCYLRLVHKYCPICKEPIREIAQVYLK